MDDEFEKGRAEAANKADESKTIADANRIIFERDCRSLYGRICSSLGRSSKYRIHFGPAPGFRARFSVIYIDVLRRHGSNNWFGKWRPGYEPTYGVGVRSDDLKNIYGYYLCYARKANFTTNGPLQYEEDGTILHASTADEFMRELGRRFGGES